MDPGCVIKITGPAEVNMAASFRRAYATANFDLDSSVSGNTVIVKGCNNYVNIESNSFTIYIEEVVNPGQVMDSSSF